MLVLVFAAVGRRSHAEGLDLPGLLRTAWPFLAGAAVGWVAAALVVDGGPRTLAFGAVVVVGAVAVGMLLRAATGQGSRCRSSSSPPSCSRSSCSAGASWPASSPDPTASFLAGRRDGRRRRGAAPGWPAGRATPASSSWPSRPVLHRRGLVARGVSTVRRRGPSLTRSLPNFYATGLTCDDARLPLRRATPGTPGARAPAGGCRRRFVASGRFVTVP
ncbi:DUF3054 domain-containing protein [Phycicoccus flavus]|uniref:DUF3054 domain-containing protein n=1 Tax=Phycicoccus flavus TaxID=2502783 RepID=UPI002AC32445|nr:DUF3054 domain-containing protein [Phycicoccus flavus]